MATLMNTRKARQLGIALVACFLVIHVVMLWLFKRYGVAPMVYFNIFSILFYTAMFFVTMRTVSRFFALAIYIEVLLHMSAAVYYTGWDSGFQITLIGMSFLMTYSEYIGKVLKVPHVRSLPTSMVGMMTYLGLCVMKRYVPARYPLPESAVFSLQIFWGFLVFAITLLFLYSFLCLTTGAEEMLESMAGHDKLTGLYNRYYLSDHLNSLDAEGGLDGCWAVMADIDDFKQINDRYGHDCGDQILKGIANILTDCGEDVTVCRWGGEEFLMVGKGCSDKEALFSRIDALRQAIAEHRFPYDGNDLHVTVTMGVAEYTPGSSIRDWISAADRKLYLGKTSGKNRVVM